MTTPVRCFLTRTSETESFYTEVLKRKTGRLLVLGMAELSGLKYGRYSEAVAAAFAAVSVVQPQFINSRTSSPLKPTTAVSQRLRTHRFCSYLMIFTVQTLVSMQLHIAAKVSAEPRQFHFILSSFFYVVSDDARLK